MSNSHNSMRQTGMDIPYSIEVGTKEIYDNNQHQDDAGSLPLTTLGHAGEVDGGNGSPSPQHQEDGMANTKCQVKFHPYEDDPAPPPEYVEDSQHNDPHNPDRPPYFTGEDSHTQEEADPVHSNNNQIVLGNLEQPYDPKVNDPRAEQLIADQILRLSFVTRIQEEGEPVLKYIQHKLATFLVAYNQFPLPWDIYYSETTKGLLDQSLASELRGYRPQPIDNYTGYRDHLAGLVETRQTKCVGETNKDIRNDGDPGDHTDSVSHNSVTNGPAQEEIDKTLVVGLCSSCKKGGHLAQDYPILAVSPTPESETKGGLDTPSPRSKVQPIDRTIERKVRPHTRSMSHQVVIQSQRAIPEPLRPPKRRTVPTLGTIRRENDEGPDQTTTTSGSEHEESLSTQVKMRRVNGTPPNEDPTCDKGPQTADNCAESFLGV